LIFNKKKIRKGILLEDATSFNKDDKVQILTSDYFAYYLVVKKGKQYLVEKELIKVLEEES